MLRNRSVLIVLLFFKGLKVFRNANSLRIELLHEFIEENLLGSVTFFIMLVEKLTFHFQRQFRKHIRLGTLHHGLAHFTRFVRT